VAFEFRYVKQTDPRRTHRPSALPTPACGLVTTIAFPMHEQLTGLHCMLGVQFG
jgi:hypothetical protein